MPNKANIVIPETTIHYEFKEKFFDKKGKFSHLVIPRSDPNQYEYDFGYIFKTIKEAKKFLKDQIESGDVEKEEANNWLLVKVETTIVK